MAVSQTGKAGHCKTYWTTHSRIPAEKLPPYPFDHNNSEGQHRFKKWKYDLSQWDKIKKNIHPDLIYHKWIIYMNHRISLIAQLVKNPPAMHKTPGSIPGSGRCTREGIGYPTPVLLSFSCGLAGKESACNAGDLGSMSGLGRSPGEGKGCPLQYSGLENSMDWIVHGVTKSQTQLSDFDFHFLYES